MFNRSLPVDYKHSDVIHMVVDQKGTFKYPVDGLWYFKMGKYEVTNAEYASFLNESPQTGIVIALSSISVAVVLQEHIAHPG